MFCLGFYFSLHTHASCAPVKMSTENRWVEHQLKLASSPKSWAFCLQNSFTLELQKSLVAELILSPGFLGRIKDGIGSQQHIPRASNLPLMMPPGYVTLSKSLKLPQPHCLTCQTAVMAGSSPRGSLGGLMELMHEYSSRRWGSAIQIWNLP